MDAKAKEWDDRYKTGKEALPWDTGEPAPELVAHFETLDKPPARVLEIGCGTGTNAIWMAQQGCKVIGTDVSPAAIDMASKKLQAATGIDVEFAVHDILAESPVAPGTVDFVFDCGVYHIMDTGKRKLFAERVGEALSTDGFWLCNAGCADEVRENLNEGPPQLKASDLVNNIEPEFEIFKLERSTFTIPNGKKYLSWIALLKKRSAATKEREGKKI